ncbi:MAG: hypothetical protein QOJ09_1609 [Actinomycetota bacterium]|nr:hypothetical protein [Actinomycetota bacterium]
MQVNKVIRKRIRRTAGGVNFVGDINAAIAGNVGESGSSSHVSVSSRQDIVQTSRRKEEKTREHEGTD